MKNKLFLPWVRGWRYFVMAVAVAVSFTLDIWAADYSRWAYTKDATAVFTWRGTSATFTGSANTFELFDVDTGEYAGKTFKATDKSTEIPGYIGETITFNNIFLSSPTPSTTRKYKAPGYVLRFDNSTKPVKELKVTTSGAFWHFGGLIVESGATGYKFTGGTSASSKYLTAFGDTNIVNGVDTWFVFNESFTISRNIKGSSLSPITHYGKVNIDIAENKTVSLNAGDICSSNILDVATSAWLKMHGKGTLNANIYACGESGVVTLDFSDLELNRATPYISGQYLAIDANTRFAFPAGFGVGSSFVLCDGEVIGPGSGEYSVIIDGAEQRVFLKFDGNTVTYVGSPKAIIDGDTKWSELKFTPEFSDGMPVELIFTTDATLTFDTDIDVPAISLVGEVKATFDFQVVPTVNSMNVPSGFDLTLSGGENSDDEVEWSGRLGVDGKLSTTGYLNLSSANNFVTEQGTLTIANGGTKLNAAEKGLGGNLTINAGAALDVLGNDSLNYDAHTIVNVRGELNLGDCKWILRDNCWMNVYDGAIIAGDGGEVGAIDLYSTIHLITENANGEATISAPICYQKGAEIDVDEGMKLTISGESKSNGGAASKVGLGRIVFMATQTGNSSNFTVEEGGVEVNNGAFVTAGTLVIDSGASLLIHGSYSKAITMNDGAILSAIDEDTTIEGTFNCNGLARIDCENLIGNEIAVLTASGITIDHFIPLDYHWAMRIADDTLILTHQNDITWQYAPGVFNWERRSDTNKLLSEGLYKQVDPISLEETGLVITGNVASVNVPGYVGTNLQSPWEIWCSTAGKRYKAPGYVMIFNSTSTDEIDAGFTDLAFGGMLVKAGAGGNSISNTSGTRQTHFGDNRVSGGVDTWFRYLDNFTINRSGDFTFHGKVNLEVAADKTLTINTHDQCKTKAFKLADGAVLKFHGNGFLNAGNALDATGEVTLDFSALDANRATPFIKSDLSVSQTTLLGFPSGWKAGKAYTLCSGTLSANNADGRRLITVAGRGSFMANVTFDMVTRSVKYQDKINEAVVPAGTDSIRWDDLSWVGGFAEGAPAIITISNDVIISIFDTTNIPVSIEVRGEGGIMFVGGNEFDGIDVTYSDNTHKGDFSFYWNGGSSGNWNQDINWNHNVRPGLFVKANFTNDVEIVANGAAAMGTIIIESANKVALTGEGNFQGLVGGVLIKRGDEIINISNSEEGVAIEGSQIEVAAGEIKLSDGAVLNAASFNLEEGASLSADENAVVTIVNQLTISNDGDVEIFSNPESGGAMLQGEAAFVKTGAGCLALGGYFGDIGNLNVAEGNLKFTGREDISSVLGKVSGNGGIIVDEEAAVLFSDATTWCANGLKGSGSVRFTMIPSAIVLDSIRNSESWQGSCRFCGVEFTDGINPADYGNESSALEFEECIGMFAEDANYLPKIGLIANETDVPSLTLVDGIAGSSIVIDRIYGEGELSITNKPTSSGYRVFLPSAAEFTGSLSIIGDDNKNGIVFGASTEDERSKFIGVDDGKIVVMENNKAEIGSSSTWTAINGIKISDNALLINRGTINSKVIGAGSVKYLGDTLAASKPEVNAEYADSNSWSGKVIFENIAFNDNTLTNAVNDNSTLTLNGATGNLKTQKIVGTTELIGDGFRVTNASANNIVKFQKVIGYGPMILDYGTVASGSAYSFLDVSEFQGAIDVRTSNGSMLIGTETRTTGAAIEFGNDVVVNGNLDWIAQKAVFKDEIKVNGSVYDSIMKITGSSIDVDNVNVILTSIDDPHRKFGLDYDNETKKVYVKSEPSSPTATLVDCHVRYGTDFGGADVVLTIADYFEGYDFPGKIVARVRIYDSNMVLRGSKDCVIDHNGENHIGIISLPDGCGGDFNYKISLTIENGDEVLEEIDSRSLAASGVRYSNGIEPESGYVDDFVKVVANVNFVNDDSVIGLRTKDGKDVVAAVQYSDGAIKVFSKGEFEDVLPLFDREVELSFFINRARNHVIYEANGVALANSSGNAVFTIMPLENAHSAAELEVFVEAGAEYSNLSGEKFDVNVAEITTKVGVQQYTNLDDAVTAAHENGIEAITLLWDASWRPIVSQLGRYKFSSVAGHTIEVDSDAVKELERQGYKVTDRGEGDISIDVIEYELSFDANGGRGTMNPMTYSITNMVFTLDENQYIRDNFEFLYWNEQADGSGTTNWLDNSEIDMRPYGLTNMTIYAQWEISTRYVCIEEADEFVYIESVKTNGVEVSGVRYFQANAKSGTGWALIPVQHGETIEITFSTDIEKELTFYTRMVPYLIKDITIPYAELPKIKGGVYTPIQLWALSNGISLDELAASKYSESSFKLNLHHLLRNEEPDKSKITIKPIERGDGSMAFTLKFDNDSLNEKSDVSGIFKVANDYAAGPWVEPDSGEVTYDVSSGTVILNRIRPDREKRFLKIVVPANAVIN